MITREAWLLAGATASGKSAAADILARAIGAAVLSADSMLVYRGMDIGTAKPSIEERARVEMGGIDLVTPAEDFSSGAWLRAAAAFVAALPPDKPLIVVGGTGLYFTALLSGLDRPKLNPEALAAADRMIAERGLEASFGELRARDPDAARTLSDPRNPRRLAAALARASAPHTPVPVVQRPRPSYPVLSRPREALRARIAVRLDEMLTDGWITEVKALMSAYPVRSKTASAAIGYAEIAAALSNGLSDTDVAAAVREKIFIRTCRLAKRQDTWFRNQADALSVPACATSEETAENVRALWQAHGPWTLRLPCPDERKIQTAP